jgi:hypothetical protein
MADGSLGPISTRPVRHGHHAKVHHADDSDEDSGGGAGPVFEQVATFRDRI